MSLLRASSSSRSNDGEQGSHGLVFVSMIDVGVVRMGVDQLLVLVAMSMRFAVRVLRRMFMLVMVVMNVKVVVFHRLVNMRVFMPFGSVKPDTH